MFLLKFKQDYMMISLSFAGDFVSALGKGIGELVDERKKRKRKMREK